jgi:hypothetical protein
MKNVFFNNKIELEIKVLFKLAMQHKFKIHKINFHTFLNIVVWMKTHIYEYT